MNTQQLVEIITDAVTDAVREALPRMVSEQIDARMAATVAPALDAQAHTLQSIQASVQERITNMQADFATRATAQADALTSSWERQVDALRAAIMEQVGQAVAGIPSLPGAAGPPGPPGRDATMVPPVHWTAGQTFRAGAVVMHGAGLWFANQDTAAEPGTGVDGYTLMFDGQELDRYEYDERGFQLAIYRHASGRVRSVETGFRPFRYAGVYDHGSTYHLNDVVTSQGCMWMAKAIHVTGVRPGTDDGARYWQLAVKSGRDGRDGGPGPRGERGERGEPGAAARVSAARRAGVQM